MKILLLTLAISAILALASTQEPNDPKWIDQLIRQNWKEFQKNFDHPITWYRTKKSRAEGNDRLHWVYEIRIVIHFIHTEPPRLFDLRLVCDHSFVCWPVDIEFKGFAPDEKPPQE